MAQMLPTIVTKKGHALMAKLVAGTATAKFTKISTSSTKYSQSSLESLTSLTNVRQTTLVSRVLRSNNATVTVEGVIENSKLSTGYYLNTIGLYALDPQEGEILYSVTIAQEPDYVPAYNGLTSTGIYLKLITTVSNAEKVSLEVDPAAVATIKEIHRLEDRIVTHLKSTMPHRFVDKRSNKAYRYGYEISVDGQPRIIYEEDI